MFRDDAPFVFFPLDQVEGTREITWTVTPCELGDWVGTRWHSW
jgi:hypothetical protein